ncbi:RidA family protein [Metapseudomonas resinovorans]|uniref:RidA family protein n=1 Tax=Metapseudomonas resinovorans TaxID=53412 RepID=UPI0018FE6E23|nr:RidA family protein [Pseudomonas resinovorans]
MRTLWFLLAPVLGGCAGHVGAGQGAVSMRAVNPPGAVIPGISQAMLVEKGRLMLLSGHVPLGLDGSVVATTLEGQMQQVMENLSATLKAADADFSNVARLTIYVRGYQPRQLEGIRAVRDRWIDRSRPPASALIGVESLFHPQVLVEIEAIAVLPE